MSDALMARIAAALGRVVNPRLGTDVVSAGMVRDLRLEPDGRVRLTFLLGAQDPASLVREVRRAVQAVDGVSEDGVRVDVKDPAQAAVASPGAMPGRPAGGQGKMLPVVEPPRPAAAPRPAAPTPVTYPNLGRIIAVSSGMIRSSTTGGGSCTPISRGTFGP